MESRRNITCKFFQKGPDHCIYRKDCHCNHINPDGTIATGDTHGNIRLRRGRDHQFDDMDSDPDMSPLTSDDEIEDI